MKQSYKIATSLDRSYFDVEVALQAESGVGLRPLPLSTILVWIAGIFGGFIIIMSENLPIRFLPIWGKILFAVGLLGFIFFATSRDQGNQTRFTAMRQMATYMFMKPTRIIKTRLTDSATEFARLVGIKDINEQTGMISFADGAYGYVYRVVGNASSLLFDSDKEAIVNRVDNYYRKLPDFIRSEYITVKEAQKVVTQKLHMKRLYQQLDNADKDLKNVMKENYRMLDEYVGGEFKSIHQYLILFANSKEYLNKAHTILANEVHSSSLMFSALEPLYKEDVIRLLRTIYAAE